MSTLETWVDEAIADPLAEGRAVSRNGGKAVGFIGADIPVELIFAAGAWPVRLVGRAEAPTPNADRYLERSFGAEIRSIAEQWLTGAYDFMHSVIFPRTSDSAQRLYYYLCELQRTGVCKGPRPLLYDLTKIKRDASRRHAVAATHALAAQLGVDETRLAEATNRCHARAVLLADLNAARLAERPLAGSFVHRVLRAASCRWNEQLDRAIGDRIPAAVPFKHRLLLVGSAPPDERFHLAVERAASTIVGEINDAGLTPQATHALAPASIEGIGIRQHESTLGSRAFVDASSALIDAVRASRADGVIIWLIEEEEALVWELPAQVRALTAEGVPALVLTRQAWAADREVLERVTHFAATLEGSR